MALTRFGLRLTASGSQDADLGSTGCLTCKKKKTLISGRRSRFGLDLLLQPWLNAGPTCSRRPWGAHRPRRITAELPSFVHSQRASPDKARRMPQARKLFNAAPILGTKIPPKG